MAAKKCAIGRATRQIRHGQHSFARHDPCLCSKSGMRAVKLDDRTLEFHPGAAVIPDSFQKQDPGFMVPLEKVLSEPSERSTMASVTQILTVASLGFSVACCAPAQRDVSILPSNKPDCAVVRSLPREARRSHLLIFFESDTDQPGRRSEGNIDEVVRDWKVGRGTILGITGHVDTAETDFADRSLGLRRAQTVAKALQRLGIPEKSIYVRDAGATELIESTGPNVPSVQNRYVSVSMDQHGSVGMDEEIEQCAAWVRRSICTNISDQNQALSCSTAINSLQNRWW